MTYRRFFRGLLCLLVVCLCPPLSGATFSVTATADSGGGSLRNAITAANSTPGADVISFNIAAAGVQTITLFSDLPAISERVTIDGTTQSGYAGKPLIELRGGSGSTAYGLQLFSGNCVVRGLAVNGFPSVGIQAFATNNIIERCFIGTDASGTLSRPNGIGLLLAFGSSNNCVGGPGMGNLISGNSDLGLCLFYSSGNVVQANLIGTDVNGTADLGNGNDGVSVDHAANNTIGGTSAGEGNVISGNSRDGIRIIDVSGSGNVIQGNLIGLDVAGSTALGNSGGGINAMDAPENTIGGSEPGARNVISGNSDSGIIIEGANATGNVVEGNFVGLNVTGSAAVPNLSSGIQVVNADQNTIGGAEPGAGNVISGNVSSGVVMFGSGNVLQGNLIGTDATGSFAVPNTGSDIAGGVLISGSGHTIGGDVAEARNIVSGNGRFGITLDNAQSCVVQGNWVGLDISGKALGNQLAGILLRDSSDNTIGGAVSAEANICSANGTHGILLTEAGTVGNAVIGNFLGVGPDGRTARGNAGAGVAIISGPFANAVGGSEKPGERNVISGNGGAGVLMSSGATSFNVIQANFIGLDSLGESPVPNGGAGIDVAGPASNVQIGGTTPGEGNRIAFNRTGVLVRNANDSGITISGNSIYANNGLSINLQPVGEFDNAITPNDPLDADNGPNHLQNSPVITNTVFTSGLTVISGYLRSTPNEDFDIEVFAGANGPYAEGQFYVGTDSTSTDGSGFAEFQLVISGNYSNQFFSAAATSSGGDTSEFSRAVPTMKGLLRITDIHRAGADIQVSLTTELGTNYTVETTASLKKPISWDPVPGGSNISGNGNVRTVTHSSAAATSPHFYRVHQF